MPILRARLVALLTAWFAAVGLLAGPAVAQTPEPAPPTTPPVPAPVVPPPAPFEWPMDAGPRLLAQRDQARLEILAREPELADAEARRDELHQRFDVLTARLGQLERERDATRADIRRSRARLSAAAADAYMTAGAESAAALRTIADAQAPLDLRRDLHLIETFGYKEIDVYEALVDRERDLTQRIVQATHERDRVKEEWDAAIAHADAVRAALEDARRRLAEAEEGIERFHKLASTAGSPIMGPNRLTAEHLAGFVRASGNTPRITVTIDELAQLYIEESEKVGIRGDVAWAQSILETGYFGFRGSMVEPGDNNFAGIGACDSCTRGFIFESARLGVRAQMQLLRTYVDKDLKVDTLPDPLLLPGTLRLGFRGRVQSWWDLTGTWATAHDYGIRVYALYEQMVTWADANPLPDPAPDPPAAPDG